jgi:predicted DNA-binding transcriptional regulator YafY
LLLEDEVEAVILGLRYVDQRGDEVLQVAADAALAKIGSVMPPQAQAEMAHPLSLPGPVGSFPENATLLGALRAAIREQVRLDIQYADEQGRRTTRIVWPVQLGFMDRARALFAWCELRGDFCTFRTDRIAAIIRLDRYRASRTELVRRLKAHSLPKAVADHIAACNAHNIETWMATFAPDALLNDISRELIGTQAIRAFGAKEIFGDNVTMGVHGLGIATVMSPSTPSSTEPTTRPTCRIP